VTDLSEMGTFAVNHLMIRDALLTSFDPVPDLPTLCDDRRT
jgi:hypothetical protein